MAESKETVLGIIQQIKDATEPYSVTNRMVAAVFDFFADELVSEQTAQDFLNLLNSKQDTIQDLVSIRGGAAAGETAVQPAEMSEVLLRAQGRSENYNGATDPVKYKSFGGEDYPSTEQRQDLIIYDINMWLDDQHCNSSATVEKMKSVPQGLMHIDQDGSCLWFINSPLSYAADTWLQIAFNGIVYETTINGVTRQYIRVSEAQDSQMWRRMCRNGEWGEWGQVSVSPTELAAITAALSSKAESVNVAEFVTQGKRMPKGALYHYNGIPLHSRAIGIDDGDIGGEEGDETECIVFCYHAPSYSQTTHGTQYFAFTINGGNYSYLCTWTYYTAPKYIKQAFGEYTEGNNLTQVLVFDNPDDLDKKVYDRVVQRLGEITGPIVPVVFYDYSDGYEIVDENSQWYTGFAYRDTHNSIRIELYGVTEGHEDVRAWLRIAKNDNTYTSTQGYHYTMTAQDKTRLNTMYSYGKSKGWWN